ncbi:MAG: hypothetical protein ABSE62_03245 [Chthoniobacteraceae bacterium]|jgi:O-antigen/teichoic acid export membrane protein
MPKWRSLSTNLATLCARLATTASLFVINGVAGRCMTHEQFGFWSMLYYMNLFTNGLDLGFQLTLGNRLASLGSRGAEAEEERRETYLSIIFLQTCFFAIDSLIVLLVAPRLPWAHWFKVTDPLLAAQVAHFISPILIVMIGTLPIGLVWTVFFAYGEIKLASAISAGCSAFQVTVFVVAAYVCKVGFTWLIFAYFACNIAVGITLTSYVFIRRRWKFGFLPVSRIVAIVRSLSRVSFHSFFLTISAIISNILAPIASAPVAGLAATGDISLLMRLFSFLSSSHLAVMSPVAPANTREARAGDWDAVRHRLRTYVFAVWPAYFLGVGGLLFWFHPLIIHLWVGHTISRYTLAALLFASACMGGFVNTFSVFLNSLGLLKVQAAVSFAMILPSILLTVILGRWLGLIGVVLASAICAVPGVIIWPLYTRRALRLRLLRV